MAAGPADGGPPAGRRRARPADERRVPRAQTNPPPVARTTVSQVTPQEEGLQHHGAHISRPTRTHTVGGGGRGMNGWDGWMDGVIDG